MSEYNVCGVLLHARQNKKNTIQSQLLLQAGLEVHAVTEEGRMVLTIENPSRKELANCIMDLHKIDGVLSVAMIYQYSDSDSDDEAGNNNHQMTTDNSNKTLLRADI